MPRIELWVTPAMVDVIEGLSQMCDCSRASVLRRAIALLKTAREARKRGEQMALVDDEGLVRARLVGY